MLQDLHLSNKVMNAISTELPAQWAFSPAPNGWRGVGIGVLDNKGRMYDTMHILMTMET